MNIFNQLSCLWVIISSDNGLDREKIHFIKTYPPSRLGYHYGKEKVKALITLANMGKVQPSKKIRIKLLGKGQDGLEVLLFRQTVSSKN